MDRNGYFQIGKKNDGIYLSIIPPQGEGKAATVEELVTYLDKKKVMYPNVAEIKKAFSEAVNTSKEVKFSGADLTPFNGWIECYANKDGSELTARMYPPTVGMPDVTDKDVENEINRLKVKYGINRDIIINLLKQKRYLDTVVIATGTQPVEGKDAEIKYYFSTNHVTKPKVNEDGSVDFHQLDLISSVKEGDVVAEIIPEDKGTPGMNIYGVQIMPRKVARKIFRYGRNLQVSDDGRKLISLVTGYVTLQDEKVFVSNEYDVASDVDNSTGNIEFDGDVKIAGNVLAGFKVRASGDIIVNGVVEGAELIAGGDIVLSRGIHGMNDGVLEAGGDVIASFIENATVKAGGNINTTAILHSNVIARGMIDVHGKKGCLTGGIVRAGTKIVARIIGSEMGTSTTVSVGTDPELIVKIDALKQRILEGRREREQLLQVINRLKKKLAMNGKLSQQQYDLLTQTVNNAQKLDVELEEARKEYRKQAGLVCEDVNARVQIITSIYPGTRIEIGDVNYYIREKNDHCQYLKRGVDIVREVL